MIYVPSNNAATHKEWHCEKCTNGLTGVSENLLEKIKFCPFCGIAVKEESILCLPYPLSAFKPYLTFFKVEKKRFYLEEKKVDGQITIGCYTIRNFSNDDIIFYNGNNDSKLRMCFFKYYNINWRVWPVYPPDDLRQRCPWNESNPLNSVITAPPLTKKEYS